MYLRYREPLWDSPELAETSSGQNPETSGGAVATRDAAPPRHSAKRRRRPGAWRGSVNGTQFPVVDLRGVRLHAITEKVCIQHILDELAAGRGGVVVTPNLDHLRRYLHDVNFGALVAEADLVVADGMPLVWASRLQRTPLPERVAGSNLISSLSAAAGGRGRSVFLLGGSEGTAKAAARVLMERYPEVKIAGWHYPPLGFENNTAEMADLVRALLAAKPDIVYVALGSPKQERLIERLRPLLPATWWLGVGNSFSFLSGEVRRAPRWMQKGGLEWLHRLVQEPRRLFRRYVVVGVPFALSLLGRSALRGVFNRLHHHAPKAPSTLTPHPDVPIRPNPQEAPAAAAAVIFPMAEVPPPEGPSLLRPRLGLVPEPERLSRLRGLVLLGGSVRTNQLAAAVGRSVLDLPIDEHGSILNHWLRQASDLAAVIGVERLPVRVMVNHDAPEPCSVELSAGGGFRVERDASAYRGTGGVLRDLVLGDPAAEYADDDLLLVANGAQLLVESLPDLARALHARGGAVSVVAHEDGTPSGIMLVACKALRLIPPEGYVDMKEQALPLIASRFDVEVCTRRRPAGVPVRSLEDYIHGLHYHHRRRNSATPAIRDPLAEDWSPTFALVESGASVDPTARIHDAVVLRGGSVEAGAVLVRCVVCAGGVLSRDRTAVDEFVCRARPQRASLFRMPGGIRA